MMALDRGGQCDGIVFRLPSGDRLVQFDRILAREIDYHDDVGTVRWTNVRTAEGSVQALLFYAGPDTGATVRKLPLQIVAARLARACGPAGSGAEYLYNTVLHLMEVGIRDRNLWRLQKLVAAEIRAIHGL